MDPKVALVMNGFIALDSDQRKELIDELNKYLQSDRKDSLHESIEKRAHDEIRLGPLGGGCPCCGR